MSFPDKPVAHLLGANGTFPSSMNLIKLNSVSMQMVRGVTSELTLSQVQSTP